MPIIDSSQRPPPGATDITASVKHNVSHVRMNITKKEEVQTLAIPAIVHKILNAIRDLDTKAVFEDIGGKPISLETFPSDRAQFDTSFGTVIKDGRSTQIILSFTVKSVQSFGTIKHSSMPILQRCNTFLCPHLSTSWERIDTITIGHLHLAHPTFADSNELALKMQIQLQETADRIQDNPDFSERASAVLKLDGTLNTTKIMFYPGRAQGKLNNEKVSSDVVEVYVARENTAAINYILEASSENSTRHLELVPRDFKYNHPDIYAKFLSAQNGYLETHRNIALVTLPTNAMRHQKVTDIDGREWHSIKMHSNMAQASPTYKPPNARTT
jgi:hypothetical protein